MAVAKEYGQRLIEKSKNADQDALDKIITQYPSHGFVIDKTEAATIFEHVRACTADEQALVNLIGNIALLPFPKPIIRFMNLPPEEKPNADGDPKPETKLNDDAPTEAGGDASPPEQPTSDGGEGSQG